MLDDAELRRAAQFLEELEKEPGRRLSPPANTASASASLSAPQSAQSNNPQETPGAPPTEIPLISNRKRFESE